MRKIIVSLALGGGLILALLLAGMQLGGAAAQGEPTPTLPLPGFFNRTPVPATPAPGVTPEGGTEAAPQLSLEWVRLDTGFSPVEYPNVTVGGPVDTYTTNLGEPCVQDIWAAQLPVVELHLLNDLDRIRVGFRADNGAATALMMWDPIEEQWWCNTEAVAGSEISFEPLVKGDYPVYVGVQGSKEKITGTLYITGEPAPAGEAPGS